MKSVRRHCDFLGPVPWVVSRADSGGRAKLINSRAHPSNKNKSTICLLYRLGEDMITIWMKF